MTIPATFIGHLVFRIHTNDAVGQITRLIISSSREMACAQRFDLRKYLINFN